MDLPGVDGISALARAFLEATTEQKSVKFTLSDGKVLQGGAHSWLNLRAAKELRGRTLDLDAAYKQMAVAKGSLRASMSAVEDEKGGIAAVCLQGHPLWSVCFSVCV